MQIATRTKCHRCGGNIIIPDDDQRPYCLMCGRPVDSKTYAGMHGGKATFKRHGKEHMSALGKRGGRPRLKTLEEIRQESEPEVTNIDEGGRLPNSLKELKALWRKRREELLSANRSSRGVN